jgi:hypothetical protein
VPRGKPLRHAEEGVRNPFTKKLDGREGGAGIDSKQTLRCDWSEFRATSRLLNRVLFEQHHLSRILNYFSADELIRAARCAGSATRKSPTTAMAPSAKTYPRATVKKIVKGHANKSLSRDVDPLVRDLPHRTFFCNIKRTIKTDMETGLP